MSADVISLSARKTDLLKADRKPREFGSHSSKSDVYVSASKSNKAFKDSLRKTDCINNKPEKCNSPLTKRLLFGKNDQDKLNDSKPIYVVDLTKKIKKVDSPFPQSESACETHENNQLSETNMLISSFDSISEKLEDQVESSNSIEKMNHENDMIQFQNLAFEIKEVIQNLDCEESKASINPEYISEMIQEESQQKSSNELSSKSKSSEAIRLRRKERKIKKRNKKKIMVKQMKEKVKTITEFVDELHRKECHTKRKDLVDELRKHLYEEKFLRLRNELKKLI